MITGISEILVLAAVYTFKVSFKIFQLSTVEVYTAVPHFVLQIILVISPESPVHRGDVVSMLSVILVASGKTLPWFAEAARTQHALVSTCIKGREDVADVAAVSSAVEEVLTEARGRIKGPAVLKWLHPFTVVLWFGYPTCLEVGRGDTGPLTQP